jgi:peptide/nickel transport system ATP-binding protein
MTHEMTDELVDGAAVDAPRGESAPGREPEINSVVAPVPSRSGVVLEISGLCVDYGDGPDATHAVVDVDLTLRRGEVVGLAGESGSGKSTLAYAATRLLRPPGIITGGDVWFYPEAADSCSDGSTRVNLLDASADSLRKIRWAEMSIVFQSAMHALNPVLSVEDQLTDTLAAHRPEMSAVARKARAAELLEMVGINRDRLRSFPHELSGGMRQRVMIAMALALQPKIVIMDEPTTALDVVTQREILEQIIDLRDRLGFSVIFITHDLSLLLELADTIAIMYAGRLVEVGPAGRLFRSPRHPYTLGLLNSFPPLHGEVKQLTGIPGSPPNLRQTPPGCPFHPRCQFSLPRCGRDRPRLVTVSIDGQRRVACFLHDGRQAPPAELGRPDVAPVSRPQNDTPGAPRDSWEGQPASSATSPNGSRSPAEEGLDA